MSLAGLKLLIAFILGIAIYAIYYWFQFHQWCPAMWFGTAPPVVIGLVTLSAYRILNRLMPG